jgi:hypothetical protein
MRATCQKRRAAPLGRVRCLECEKRPGFCSCFQVNIFFDEEFVYTRKNIFMIMCSLKTILSRFIVYSHLAAGVLAAGAGGGRAEASC